MEDRERLGRRVVAGVVAERAFARELVLGDVALEDDLRVGRNLEVDGLRLDELHRLAAQEAREHQLVDVLRERRARRVCRDGIEPDRDDDVEPAVGQQVVGAAVLVDLPVHRGRVPVEHLQPVHADVAPAGARVLRDHRGEGDERRRVARPTGLDGQGAEVDLASGENNLLRRPTANTLRLRVCDRLQLAQALDLLEQALRRLHLEHIADAPPRLVEALDPECEAHPPLGSELVDQEGVLRLGVLEEERRPARLHHAVGDLRDLQVRVDLGRDADELAFALEKRDPVPEISHRGQSRRESAYAIAASGSSARPSAHSTAVWSPS